VTFKFEVDIADVRTINHENKQSDHTGTFNPSNHSCEESNQERDNILQKVKI